MKQIIYRKLRVEEAQKFWDMMNELDKETKFMMYEVGEREEKAVNLQALECQIQNAIEDNDFLLIAEVEGEIAGYLSAERGVPNRIKHTAYVVTGVREKYRGCGIGKELFQRLDLWAKENDVTRVVEGIKKNSMIIDGQYVDEFYMAKLF